MNGDEEAIRIKERYKKRTEIYAPLDGWVFQTKQERERVIGRFIRQVFGVDVAGRRLLDIGCGNGDNLLYFIRLGFDPKNLQGVELIGDRAVKSRARLPLDTNVEVCNAARLRFENETMDVVFQSLVFSSILDKDLARQVAGEMWRVLKRGGIVVWYDFVYDNPANRNVRGISKKELREYFPDAEMIVRRVTLAPPISRRACAISDRLYPILNVLPLLRSHVVCMLKKP